MNNNIQAIVDRFEIEALRGEFTDAAMMRDYDRLAPLRWLDVGGGTGALTAAVLAGAEPASVVGVDPSEGLVMSLSEERRAALRERLRARLSSAPDGSVPLTARAWAVRGTAFT